MLSKTNVVRFLVKAGRHRSLTAFDICFEELSLELGVTDPVSGAVVFEKHMS